MTAGKGVVHSEMPKQTDGLVRGFQLWLNLPKEKNDRTSIPRYFSGSNPMHKLKYPQLRSFQGNIKTPKDQEGLTLVFYILMST